MKHFVLLQYFNDYDQHGGYYSGTFTSKEEVLKVVNHIGREGNENSWYEIETLVLNNLEMYE